MTDPVESRIERLVSGFEAKGIDTLLVLISENRQYLSGFTGEDGGWDESAGALLIADERRILATDSRYTLQAKNEAPRFEVREYKKGLIKAMPDLLRELKTEKLGFEPNKLSVAQHDKLQKELAEAEYTAELVPVEGLSDELRLIKARSEIEAMRRSLILAERVFAEFLSQIREGMSEKEAAWAMEKGMREAGADGLSFPVIAASGPNAALPHAVPTDRRFKRGEPILFDWGARLDHYCSDISRTVILDPADDQYQKVFDTVKAAQQMAIEAIRPGASSRAVDGVAREYIRKMGFEGKFGHGLGHGVGLAIHESPRISPIKDTELKAGMVFTVEPGIYLPDWGGVRLENMVAVTESGAEVLNTMPVVMEL